MKNFKLKVSQPKKDKPSSFVLNKADVWGEYDEEKRERLSDGMIIAKTDDICPIFGDVVPYKAVTIICKKSLYGAVEYWIEYVHGTHSITEIKVMYDTVAIRSEYQCY